VDISNAYDLHIHSNPSLFERIGDDIYIANHAKEAGLTGILLKNHFESTVGRAAIVKNIIGDLYIFGGLVLNSFAGGLNPVAVETALKLGAKEIWLPTIDSKAHAKVFGHLGGFGYQESVTKVKREAITILDDGKIKEEVKIIVELVRDYDVILGTAHLGKDEIFLLAEFAHQINFSKLLITHPFFNPPNLNVKELVRLVQLGSKIELCGGNLYPIPGVGRIDNYRETIREVGAESIILTSDAGQPRKSLPYEVLRVFSQCLMEKGITQSEIDIMVKENPAYLLSI
ncbi:MAG: hypothetical protein JRI44_13495, partial [Deltaproteobacteria bacterium]|nr:hypothetical protein [Deltaproteobacteria bacterium]